MLLLQNIVGGHFKAGALLGAGTPQSLRVSCRGAVNGRGPLLFQREEKCPCSCTHQP